MRSARLLVASLAALVVSAPAVFAEPVTFKIDRNHSVVGFSIRHFFSKVSGRFNDFEGAIQYDEKNPASSSVDVTIKTASIFTNNERRDTDLRSANFFLADSFPTITFKTTRVTPGTEGKLKVEGDLTMRGVTRPVVLDVAFLGSGAVGIGGHAMGVRAGWEASTTVNRKDFNILWNQTLDQGGTLLGDEVAIQLGVEAAKVDAAQGAAPAKK